MRARDCTPKTSFNVTVLNEVTVEDRKAFKKSLKEKSKVDFANEYDRFLDAKLVKKYRKKYEEIANEYKNRLNKYLCFL